MSWAAFRIVLVIVGIVVVSWQYIPYHDRIFSPGLFDNQTEFAERWDNPAECQLSVPGYDGYFSVTIDGAEYFCREVEQVTGFPMIVILHRGENTRIEKAARSIVIEKK